VSKVYCGIAWAEKYHDVAVVDAAGNLIANGASQTRLSGLRS
jgi:hypothetical protein